MHFLITDLLIFLEEKIETVLCNGISERVLKESDTIVIAGMGGETIVKILINFFHIK